MSRIALTASLIALLLPASGVVAASWTQAAVPTCEGKAATIVPGRDDQAIGTPGDDVIVANQRALPLEAGGGNDTICVIYRRGAGLDHVRPSSPRVDAGPGDDVVVVSGPPSWDVHIELGDGADTLRAGAERDVVRDGTPLNEYEYEPDGDADTITTGEGDDHVEIEGPRHEGGPATSPRDSVDGGGGDDTILFGAFPSLSEVQAIGGPGRDVLFLVPFTTLVPAERALLDLPASRYLRDDREYVTWQGVEDFGVWYADTVPTRVIGTEGEDRVRISVVTDADLGAGDDRLSTDVTEAEARLDGGPGTDYLSLSQGVEGDRFTVDLDGRAAILQDAEVIATAALAGFEDAKATGWRGADLFGTAGPNRLKMRGCDGVVAGRGGDDTIMVGEPNDHDCPFQVVRGGPGNDDLRGSYRRDRLLGGAGYDRASGGRSIDLCRAEVRDSCER